MTESMSKTPGHADHQSRAAADQECFLDYFSQVRIINMRKRKDRRTETVQEFRRHGLPVDTEQIRFFPAITPSEAEGFPNPGVRGCYLSHLEILEEALHEAAGNVFVLEDDIAFTKHISTWGPQAVNQLELLEWDIAYLGHAQEPVPGDTHWIPVDQPMQLAHCYAVNGRVLLRLTEFLQAILQRPAGHPEGGPMHYDGALSTFILNNPDIKAFYCSRNLGYQRPSKTDLHHLSSIERNPIFRHGVKLYRIIKQTYLRSVR